MGEPRFVVGPHLSQAPMASCFSYLLQLSSKMESYHSSPLPQEPHSLHTCASGFSPPVLRFALLERGRCVCDVLFYCVFSGLCPLGHLSPLLLSASVPSHHCCLFPDRLLAGFVFSISMATNLFCRESHLAFIEGTCNYLRAVSLPDPSRFKAFGLHPLNYYVGYQVWISIKK